MPVASDKTVMMLWASFWMFAVACSNNSRVTGDASPDARRPGDAGVARDAGDADVVGDDGGVFPSRSGELLGLHFRPAGTVDGGADGTDGDRENRTLELRQIDPETGTSRILAERPGIDAQHNSSVTFEGRLRTLFVMGRNREEPGIQAFSIDMDTGELLEARPLGVSGPTNPGVTSDGTLYFIGSDTSAYGLYRLGPSDETAMRVGEQTFSDCCFMNVSGLDDSAHRYYHRNPDGRLYGLDTATGEVVVDEPAPDVSLVGVEEDGRGYGFVSADSGFRLVEIQLEEGTVTAIADVPFTIFQNSPYAYDFDRRLVYVIATEGESSRLFALDLTTGEVLSRSATDVHFDSLAVALGDILI